MNSESIPIYSVEELNHAIGNLIERGFAPRFSLLATVSKSQLKNGHLWLTLTDGKASISAVIWASTLRRLSFRPNEKDGVEILGKLNFWKTRATFNVQVLEIRPTISTVLRKFEVVRKILTKEGLISENRRRDLPTYPENIAILTSIPSSALADILRTAKERWPLTKLFLFSIPVQGDVALKIKNVLDLLVNSYQKLNLQAIVLARGGGSREDLMVFDNEELCRSLAGLPIPLITGLGHEDDLTIADLVADHSSATPTAAIVDLLPSRDVAKENCLQIRQRLKDYLKWSIDKQRQRVEERKIQWKSESPFFIISKFREILDKKEKLLNALSPDSLFKRGFCIVTNESGKTVRKYIDTTKGEKIKIQLIDGHINANVVNIKSEIDL